MFTFIYKDFTTILKEIIPCIYERAYYFKDGKVIVKKYNKEIYIDNKGKELTEYKYDSIFDRPIFGATDSTLAIVTQNGLDGIINENCQELLPCEFFNIKIIGKNIVCIDLVKNDNCTFVNLQ